MLRFPFLRNVYFISSVTDGPAISNVYRMRYNYHCNKWIESEYTAHACRTSSIVHRSRGVGGFRSGAGVPLPLHILHEATGSATPPPPHTHTPSTPTIPISISLMSY